MSFSTDFTPPFRPPAHPVARYVLALAAVAAATLLRFAVDPVVHEQVPYFVYIGGIVVATWLGGVGGGILATIVATFAGNYFFVSPRHDIYFSHEDVGAMAVFAVFSFGLVWLVGRWRAAEVQTRRLHARTFAVLDQMPVAVVLAEPSGRVLFNNVAALRMFGRPSEPAGDIRRFRDDLRYEAWRPDGTRLDPADSAIVRALKGETVSNQEMHVVHADGRRRVLNVSASPIRDDDGRLVSAVAAMVDITEQKAAAERLRQQAEQLGRLQRDLEGTVEQLRAQAGALERANRVKDEFLATLSHELRTPLNAVLGWSQLLLGPDLPADAQRKALESINRNARSQAALISDILDVSRIITGKLRLDVHQVDLGNVVRAACEALQPAADAKGITVRTAIEGQPALVGDPDRLQQVVWNLLSNAVKFSDRGGRVDVDVRRVNSHVEITVKDDGQGIAPEFLPRVFERFLQADSSSTRTQTGLGLGLAIVRHLVELHGGTVAAESAGPGRGATFKATLPVRAVVEPLGAGEHVAADRMAGGPPVPMGCLAGLHVVTVDDQEDARLLIRTVLERYGARVTLCSSADEALVAVPATRPDLLLADIGMPGMDGYELLRRLRALPDAHARRMPAIALTAYGGERDRAKSRGAGYCQHLAKPILPEALVAAVAGAAGRLASV
jgi:signal transduction histidine kinase